MTARDVLTLLLIAASAVAVYFSFAIAMISAVPLALGAPIVDFFGAILALLAVPAIAPRRRQKFYVALAGTGILALEAWLAIASQQRPLQLAILVIGWASLLFIKRRLVVVLAIFPLLVAASTLDLPSLRQPVPPDFSPHQSAISDFRSYRIRSFFDEEALWRIDAPVDTLDQIARQFYAEPVNTVPPQFFRIAPWYWPSRLPRHWKAAATPEFPAARPGSDTSHYFMLIDLDVPRAYVWYKSVF